VINPQAHLPFHRHKIIPRLPHIPSIPSKRASRYARGGNAAKTSQTTCRAVHILDEFGPYRLGIASSGMLAQLAAVRANLSDGARTVAAPDRRRKTRESG